MYRSILIDVNVLTYINTQNPQNSTKDPRKLVAAGTSCLRHVGDLHWWESLTMIPLRNKAKHLSSVNHTTKTIHHLHHQLLNYFYFLNLKKWGDNYLKLVVMNLKAIVHQNFWLFSWQSFQSVSEILFRRFTNSQGVYKWRFIILEI